MTSAFASRRLNVRRFSSWNNLLNSFPSRQLEIAPNSSPSYQLELALDDIKTSLSEGIVNSLWHSQIDIIPNGSPGYQFEIPFDALSNGQFGEPEASLGGFAASLVERL